MAAVEFVVYRVLQSKFEIIQGKIVSFKDEAVAVGRSASADLYRIGGIEQLVLYYRSSRNMRLIRQYVRWSRIKKAIRLETEAYFLH